MKLKPVFKRAGALALSSALALGLLPILTAREAEAADFSLGSGFSDPTITVATMYYWKEGLPPVVKNRDGKTEGSTVGVEYPVIISWGENDGTQYYMNITDTDPIQHSWNNGEQYPAIGQYVNYTYDHDDNNYNQPDEEQYYHGEPAGWLAHHREYSYHMVSLFESMSIARSLRENGVAASMDVPTNMYLVPVGEAYGYQHYGLEIGEGSNRWLVGEHFFRSDKRKSRGFDNSLDWYLEVRDVDKAHFTDVNWRMPAKYASVSNVDGYSSSADYTTSSFPHRTWDFARTSDGYYTIATDGDAGWYVEDGGGSVVDGWTTTQHDYVKGNIWNFTEFWLQHDSPNAAAFRINYNDKIKTYGDWYGVYDHGTAAESDAFKYRVFYGEPNLVSFLQSDTRVQSGQVVNLDGPIVIGENATVTVESGGVLVVSGWVQNGGYIMVKRGGMLIVQDQERLDGTKQYGVINSFFERDMLKKNGRIACDGVMIVNRDCKVIGSGRYGLQFGAGAHCVNYGQLVGSHMEVYSDHAIENRGGAAAVYAGYVLSGGGFALANQKLTAGDLDGLLIPTVNGKIRMPENAVYGSAGWQDGRWSAFYEPPTANRTGHVTDIDPYISTYAVETDAAQGVSFVRDSALRRYDWYDSLQDYVRFEYVGGTLTSYVFGGRAVPETPPADTRSPNVADFDAARRQFFIRDNGVTYWYDPEKAAFLDENALTDTYYPGTPVFPGGVLGAEIVKAT